MDDLRDLFWAIQKHNVALTQKIVRKLESVNVMQTWRIKDILHSNVTPLTFAAYMGNKDIVRMLVDNGADPNISTNLHWYPIHFAAEEGHVTTVDILLQAGAKVDPRNSENCTPIMLAAKNNFRETVRKLTDAGSTIDGMNEVTYNKSHTRGVVSGGGGIVNISRFSAAINENSSMYSTNLSDSSERQDVSTSCATLLKYHPSHRQKRVFFSTNPKYDEEMYQRRRTIAQPLSSSILDGRMSRFISRLCREDASNVQANYLAVKDIFNYLNPNKLGLASSPPLSLSIDSEDGLSAALFNGTASSPKESHSQVNQFGTITLADKENDDQRAWLSLMNIVELTCSTTFCTSSLRSICHDTIAVILNYYITPMSFAGHIRKMLQRATRMQFLEMASPMFQLLIHYCENCAPALQRCPSNERRSILDRLMSLIEQPENVLLFRVLLGFANVFPIEFDLHFENAIDALIGCCLDKVHFVLDCIPGICYVIANMSHWTIKSHHPYAVQLVRSLFDDIASKVKRIFYSAGGNEVMTLNSVEQAHELLALVYSLHAVLEGYLKSTLDRENVESLQLESMVSNLTDLFHQKSLSPAVYIGLNRICSLYVTSSVKNSSISSDAIHSVMEFLFDQICFLQTASKMTVYTLTNSSSEAFLTHSDYIECLLRTIFVILSSNVAETFHLELVKQLFDSMSTFLCRVYLQSVPHLQHLVQTLLQRSVYLYPQVVMRQTFIEIDYLLKNLKLKITSEKAQFSFFLNTMLSVLLEYDSLAISEGILRKLTSCLEEMENSFLISCMEHDASYAIVLCNTLWKTLKKFNQPSTRSNVMSVFEQLFVVLIRLSTALTKVLPQSTAPVHPLARLCRQFFTVIRTCFHDNVENSKMIQLSDYECFLESWFATVHLLPQLSGKLSKEVFGLLKDFLRLPSIMSHQSFLHAAQHILASGFHSIQPHHVKPTERWVALMSTLPQEVLLSTFCDLQENSRTGSLLSPQQRHALQQIRDISIQQTQQFGSSFLEACMSEITFPADAKHIERLRWMCHVMHMEMSKSLQGAANSNNSEITFEQRLLLEQSQLIFCPWVTANQLINQRLRYIRPWTSPKDFFLSVESRLKTCLARIDGIVPSIDSSNSSKPNDSGTIINSSVLRETSALLGFMDAFEKWLTHAFEGASLRLPPVAKTVQAFFQKNRGTCTDWLNLMRFVLLRLALEVHQPATALHHAIFLLSDPSYKNLYPDINELIALTCRALLHLGSPEWCDTVASIVCYHYNTVEKNYSCLQGMSFLLRGQLEKAFFKYFIPWLIEFDKAASRVSIWQKKSDTRDPLRRFLIDIMVKVMESDNNIRSVMASWKTADQERTIVNPTTNKDYSQLLLEWNSETKTNVSITNTAQGFTALQNDLNQEITPIVRQRAVCNFLAVSSTYCPSNSHLCLPQLLHQNTFKDPVSLLIRKSDYAVELYPHISWEEYYTSPVSTRDRYTLLRSAYLFRKNDNMSTALCVLQQLETASENFAGKLRSYFRMEHSKVLWQQGQHENAMIHLAGGLCQTLLFETDNKEDRQQNCDSNARSLLLLDRWITQTAQATRSRSIVGTGHLARHLRFLTQLKDKVWIQGLPMLGSDHPNLSHYLETYENDVNSSNNLLEINTIRHDLLHMVCRLLTPVTQPKGWYQLAEYYEKRLEEFYATIPLSTSDVKEKVIGLVHECQLTMKKEDEVCLTDKLVEGIAEYMMDADPNDLDSETENFRLPVNIEEMTTNMYPRIYSEVVKPLMTHRRELVFHIGDAYLKYLTLSHSDANGINRSSNKGHLTIKAVLALLKLLEQCGLSSPLLSKLRDQHHQCLSSWVLVIPQLVSSLRRNALAARNEVANVIVAILHSLALQYPCQLVFPLEVALDSEKANKELSFYGVNDSPTGSTNEQCHKSVLQHNLVKMLHRLLYDGVSVAKYSNVMNKEMKSLPTNANMEQRSGILKRSQYSEQLYRTMVHQVCIFNGELRRISLLWDELWIICWLQRRQDMQRRVTLLEAEIRRLKRHSAFSESERSLMMEARYRCELESIMAMIRRLAAITGCGMGATLNSDKHPKHGSSPSTPHEAWFKSNFSEKIRDCIHELNDKRNAMFPMKVFHCIDNLVNTIRSQSAFAHRHTHIHLRLPALSPTLAKLLSGLDNGMAAAYTAIPLPGLRVEEGNIFLSRTLTKVHVIPTKTRPRELNFQDDRGQVHSYLFKGVEDLHLDQRLMNFLHTMNLVLAKESHDATFGPKFHAHDYPVIPLGLKLGLIRMVPNLTSMYSLYKKWQAEGHVRIQRKNIIDPTKTTTMPQLSTNIKPYLSTVPVTVQQKTLPTVTTSVAQAPVILSRTESGVINSSYPVNGFHMNVPQPSSNPPILFSPVELDYYGTTDRHHQYSHQTLSEMPPGVVADLSGEEATTEGVSPLNAAHIFFNALQDAFKEVTGESQITFEDLKNFSKRRKWPKDVLHKAFLKIQSDVPDTLLLRELWYSSLNGEDWWSMQTSVSQSMAVMCIIGYLLGLGDRHLDNILIDFSSGNVVHIDYNVCLDRGQELCVPETVDFRMTQNVSRAVLGPLADHPTQEFIAGPFTAACEATLKLARSSRPVLFRQFHSILEDPYVDWRQQGHVLLTKLEERRLMTALGISLISEHYLLHGDPLRSAICRSLPTSLELDFASECNALLYVVIRRKRLLVEIIQAFPRYSRLIHEGIVDGRNMEKEYQRLLSHKTHLEDLLQCMELYETPEKISDLVHRLEVYANMQQSLHSAEEKMSNVLNKYELLYQESHNIFKLWISGTESHAPPPLAVHFYNKPASTLLGNEHHLVIDALLDANRQCHECLIKWHAAFLSRVRQVDYSEHIWHDVEQVLHYVNMIFDEQNNSKLAETIPSIELHLSDKKVAIVQRMSCHLKVEQVSEKLVEDRNSFVLVAPSSEDFAPPTRTLPQWLQLFEHMSHFQTASQECFKIASMEIFQRIIQWFLSSSDSTVHLNELLVQCEPLAQMLNVMLHWSLSTTEMPTNYAYAGWSLFFSSHRLYHMLNDFHVKFNTIILPESSRIFLQHFEDCRQLLSLLEPHMARVRALSQYFYSTSCAYLPEESESQKSNTSLHKHLEDFIVLTVPLVQSLQDATSHSDMSSLLFSTFYGLFDPIISAVQGLKLPFDELISACQISNWFYTFDWFQLIWERTSDWWKISSNQQQPVGMTALVVQILSLDLMFDIFSKLLANSTILMSTDQISSSERQSNDGYLYYSQSDLLEGVTKYLQHITKCIISHLPSLGLCHLLYTFSDACGFPPAYHFSQRFISSSEELASFVSSYRLSSDLINCQDLFQQITQYLSLFENDIQIFLRREFVRVEKDFVERGIARVNHQIQFFECMHSPRVLLEKFDAHKVIHNLQGRLAECKQLIVSFESKIPQEEPSGESNFKIAEDLAVRRYLEALCRYSQSQLTSLETLLEYDVLWKDYQQAMSIWEECESVVHMNLEVKKAFLNASFTTPSDMEMQLYEKKQVECPDVNDDSWIDIIKTSISINLDTCRVQLQNISSALLDTFTALVHKNWQTLCSGDSNDNACGPIHVFRQFLNELQKVTHFSVCNELLLMESNKETNLMSSKKQESMKLYQMATHLDRLMSVLEMIKMKDLCDLMSQMAVNNDSFLSTQPFSLIQPVDDFLTTVSLLFHVLYRFLTLIYYSSMNEDSFSNDVNFSHGFADSQSTTPSSEEPDHSSNGIALLRTLFQAQCMEDINKNDEEFMDSLKSWSQTHPIPKRNENKMKDPVRSRTDHLMQRFLNKLDGKDTSLLSEAVKSKDSEQHNLPFNEREQVLALIAKARDPLNLAMMYEGWTAWV